MFAKGKIFENKKSEIMSTQVNSNLNCLTGFYSAVKLYQQEIYWGNASDIPVPFLADAVQFFCECKYFQQTGNCCKHVIEQLRRVLYNSI